MKLFKKPGVILIISILAAEMVSIGLPTPVRAASIPSTIQFTPVVSGLTNPVFLTNAGDGSNRLFILQQGGQFSSLRTAACCPRHSSIFQVWFPTLQERTTNRVCYLWHLIPITAPTEIFISRIRRTAVTQLFPTRPPSPDTMFPVEIQTSPTLPTAKYY